MGKTRIAYIHLPAGTIIYAPLYVAAIRSNSDFTFQFRTSSSSIVPSPHRWRRALSPVLIDPVFSPVIHRQKFPENPRSWFAVGDPLRVRRLVECHGPNQCSFTFLGTFVTHLAFWVLSERRGPYKAAENRSYNYISCHTKGMTGYHLAEHLFGVSPAYNPLAPTSPGREVGQFFRMLKADWERTQPGTDHYYNDPVTFAVLTTEIGHALYHMDRLKKQMQILFDLEHVSTNLFPSKITSDEFIMTTLVSRLCEDDPSKADLIRAAGESLRESLIDSLNLLRTNPKSFSSALAEFYDSYRGSFSSPTSPHDVEFQLEEAVEELSSLYTNGNNTHGLLASQMARNHTDELLRRALKSEYASQFGRNPAEHVLEKEFNKLCTSTWQGQGSLWT